MNRVAWLTRPRTCLWLLLLSAALVGLGRIPWLRVTLAGTVRNDVLTASAADLAPMVPAAAIVGLAGAAALSIAGVRAARAVLALITAAAGLAVYGCISVLANPEAGTRGMLGDRVVTGASSSLTYAGWLALVCAVLLGVGSLVAQAAVAGWPARRRSGERFERSSDGVAARSPAGDWDALSRGEDPTGVQDHRQQPRDDTSAS